MTGAGAATPSGIGARLADLEISRAWLVDPATDREGPGEIVVEDGILVAVTWLEGWLAAYPGGLTTALSFRAEM